jgi:hypothetical protein
MKINQKHNFLGGLNTDDDLRMFPESDYRFAQNIRSQTSETDHQGVVENVFGTLPIALPNGFSDTIFTILGSYEDKSKRHNYFFACDITSERPGQSRRHTIFRYDGQNVVAILTSATLGLNPDYPITHASIIENLLFFTDGLNPPMQINVNTIGSASSPLNGVHLSVIKPPPMNPLYLTVQRDPRFSTQKLKQIIQLTYRFVFFDGQNSTCAPYSLIQHGYDSKFYFAEFKQWGNMYGCTENETLNRGGQNILPYTDPRFYEHIEYVEIFVRESQYLPFKLMRRIDVREWISNPDYTIIDPNSTTLAMADQAEIGQLFDSVPLRSQTLQVADNRIFLGNNLEEYPRVEGFSIESVQVYSNGNWNEVRLADDQDLGVINTPENILKDPQVGQQLSFKAGGIYQLGLVFYDEYNRSSLVYTNESLKVKFPHLAPIDAGILIGQSSARAGFARDSGGSRPGITGGGIKIFFESDNAPEYGLYDGSLNTYIGNGDFVCRTAGTYTFSGQVQIRIGNTFNRRIYVNLFRNGSSVANTSFLIPPTVSDIRTRQFTFSNIAASLNDTFHLQISKESGGRDYLCELFQDKDTYMEMKLTQPIATRIPVYNCAVGFRFPNNFQPPDWAVSYQLVRTDALNYDFFLQGFTGKMQWYRTDPLDINKRIGISGYTNTDQDSASHLYIRIKQWYSAAYSNVGKTQSNPPNEIYYNFQKGDKVAFYLGQVRYEYDIIEFSEDSLVIKRPFLSSELVIPEQSNLFVEVYREKKILNADSLKFYEVGEWYPILYPKSESRQWSKSDWTYSGNDNVERSVLFSGHVINHRYPFTFGDVHVIQKPFYVENQSTPITNVYTQSMHPDIDRISEAWEHAGGRPNTAYLDTPKQWQKISQIRFSDRYVTDSKINNTNRFYEFNQNSLPANYGPIQSMRIGHDDGLESAGQILLTLTENECVSIYINRRRLEDLSGSTNILASDQVIGSYNTIKGSYGTQHPLSVVEYGGNVYYFCATKGCVVRYGRDGLTPISLYKMRNFFQSRSNTEGNIIGGFDPYHSQYIISFAGATENHTIAFNELSNQWESFYSFIPDITGTIGVDLLSFKDGQLYIHGKGDINTFYGIEYFSQVKIVTNIDPSSVKVFQNISIESSDRWEVISFTTPEGQLSRVLIDRWKKKENIYYADILRDINTPNVQYPIINGHPIRSTVLETLLQLDNEVNAKSYLFFVNLYMQKSQLSNPIYR